MREDFKQLAIRAVRILFAIIVTGGSLFPAFHGLIPPEPKPKEELYPLPAQGAQIERRLTVQVNDGRLRAHQFLGIRGDARLCAAIHASAVRQYTAAADTYPMEWAVGAIALDRFPLPFNAPEVTATDDGGCTVRTSTDEVRIFEGQDALPTASDSVRFEMPVFRGNEVLVVFHTENVRVGGITKASSGPVHGGAAFRWSGNSAPRAVLFRLMRGAPLRLVDVVTRVDQNWLPFVKPPLTAILTALPFALFVVIGRRYASERRWPLVEMAGWLLTLYAFLYLTWIVVETNDWLPEHNDGPFTVLFVALACAIGPLLIFRWLRNGATSWVVENGPKVPRTSIVALGIFVSLVAVRFYSQIAMPRHWWYAREEAIVALAIAAFAAGCWWLVRELGGTIVHAAILFVITGVLFPLPGEYEPAPTLVLAALFLWALFAAIGVVVTQTRKLDGTAVFIVLLAAIFAHLLVPLSAGTRLSDVRPVVEGAYNVAIFALLVAFLILLRDHSGSGKPSGEAVDLGVAFALATFFDDRYGLYGAVVIGSAFLLLRYCLFVPEVTRALRQNVDPATIRKGINNLIAKREVERALDGLRKTLRGKIASDEKKWTDYETSTGALETVISQYEADAATIQASERALANGPQVEPWLRAVPAAIRAALLAIPWCVAYAAVYSGDLVPARTQYWLDVIVVFAFGVLQWAMFGFFFGYFYPDIRGRNGLQKALTFFTAFTVPNVLAYLIFNGAWPQQLLTLWILQLLIQSMVLGIIDGDYRTLQSYGLRWTHLRDVHDFGVLAAYGTTLTAAVITAITTALATGIGGVFTKLLFS